MSIMPNIQFIGKENTPMYDLITSLKILTIWKANHIIIPMQTLNSYDDLKLASNHYRKSTQPTMSHEVTNSREQILGIKYERLILTKLWITAVNTYTLNSTIQIYSYSYNMRHYLMLALNTGVIRF